MRVDLYAIRDVARNLYFTDNCPCRGEALLIFREADRLQEDIEAIDTAFDNGREANAA